MGNTNREGTATSWRNGIIKRQLDIVNVVKVANDPTNIADAPFTQKYWLEGLSTNLNVGIVVALAGQGDRAVPFYPAAPGTVVVRPWVKTPSGQVLYQNPLTSAGLVLPAAFVLGSGFRQGGNLVQNDFGVAMCDGAQIEITVDPASYAGQPTQGNIILAVTGEYNGHWWDVETITRHFGALRLSGSNIINVQSAGS